MKTETKHDVPEGASELVNQIERDVRDIVPWVADGETGAALLRISAAVDGLAQLGRLIYDNDNGFGLEHEAADRVLQLPDDTRVLIDLT